jgi:hypothetical protein
LEKNYRRHHYSLEENDLSIDNIEVISCREESKLDESSICNFCEIIDSESYQQQLKSMPELLKGELTALCA